MDNCREEFEKAFPIPAHWIEFNEKSNEYYCPYVADAKAFEYQSQWVVWQHQQKRIDELQQKYDDLNTRASQIAWDQMTTAKLNYELEVKLKALQKEIDEIS